GSTGLLVRGAAGGTVIGSVTAFNDGLISGDALGAAIGGGIGSLTNAGTIEGRAADSVGLVLAGATGSSLTHQATGVIEGGTGAILGAGVNGRNDGLIIGHNFNGLSLGAGAGVTNTNLIVGALSGVAGAAGSDVVNSAAGTIVGAVAGVALANG